MKFLGSISDVNINNCVKFCSVTMPGSYISRNELFERFWTLQTHNLLFEIFLQILHLLVELGIW